MSNDVVATAKVRITIEVPTSTWGKDCTVEQILETAERLAVQCGEESH